MAIVALIFFLGIIVGTVVGEVIGILLPEGKVIREVFVSSTDLNVGPLHLDLVVFSFTLGFSLRVNLMSAVGIFIASLMLRWYW